MSEFKRGAIFGCGISIAILMTAMLLADAIK